MQIQKIVLSNMLWRLAERIGAKGVELIVSIILARMIAPEVFGSIALITVVMTVMQVFVDSGLGNALIQKKDADEIDFSSVFFFNIFFCIVVYSSLYIASPTIANYFNDIELTNIIRVLGLSILISGVKNVQQSFVTRNLLFKKFFLSTLIGTVIAAIVGISMAYKGLGVWALVVQQVLNNFIDTIILWITVKWRPSFCFSFSRLKKLIGFGWKLLVASLLETTYRELRQFIIGKKYSTTDLAFYNRASQFPQFITSNINSSIDSVLFPTLSRAQSDKVNVKHITRRSIQTSIYLMAPFMIGLAVCGEEITILLLTDKWIPLVPYLRIFCAINVFLPIHTSNLNAIKAMGRSDLYLNLEIIKKILGFSILLLSMNYGVMAMAYSLLLSEFLSQLINTWPSKSLFDYSYSEQIKDITPSLLLSGMMGMIIYLIRFIGLSPVLTLIIQIIIGVSVYYSGSRIMRLEAYYYSSEMLRILFSRFMKETKEGA